MSDDKKRQLFFEKSPVPSASDLKTAWTLPPSDYVIGGLNADRLNAEFGWNEKEGAVYVTRKIVVDHVRSLDPARRVDWTEEEKLRFIRNMRAHRHLVQVAAPKPPTLDRLSSWSDALPIDLRRQVKAMAGDYQPEIGRLHAEGRHGFAWWNAKLAWITAAWMVLKWPLAAARDYLFKGFTAR